MKRQFLGIIVGVCVRVLGTLGEGSSQLVPSDEPTVQFLHASDDWKKQSSRI
jgi:hypothetical protein